MPRFASAGLVLALVFAVTAGGSSSSNAQPTGSDSTESASTESTTHGRCAAAFCAAESNLANVRILDYDPEAVGTDEADDVYKAQVVVFDEFERLVGESAAVAPEAIRDDVTALSEDVSVWAEDVRNAGSLEALEGLAENPNGNSDDDADLEAASRRVDVWIDQNCDSGG